MIETNIVQSERTGERRLDLGEVQVRKDLAIALSKKFPTKKIIAPPYGDFSYYDIFFRLLQKEKDLSSDSSPKIKDYFKKLDLKKDKNKLVYYFKISWIQK